MLDGSLFCFDNERGISLGQHVLPTCLFCSRASISCFNISLDIAVVAVVVACAVVVSVKYFDLVFFFVVVLSFAFRFFPPSVVVDTADATDNDTTEDISTKQSI